MKIEIREDRAIQLKEVFRDIVIVTTEGVEFYVCQGDYGIIVTCNGVTKYIDKNMDCSQPI